MRRIAADSLGPGQALAIEIIRLVGQSVARESTITVRRVPAYQGTGGNEQAGRRAKETAISPGAGRRAPLRYSLASLKRAVTERATQRWQSDIEEKWEGDVCWWCRKGRQSREHLFQECTAWTTKYGNFGLGQERHHENGQRPGKALSRTERASAPG